MLNITDIRKALPVGFTAQIIEDNSIEISSPDDAFFMNVDDEWEGGEYDEATDTLSEVEWAGYTFTLYRRGVSPVETDEITTDGGTTVEAFFADLAAFVKAHA